MRDILSDSAVRSRLNEILKKVVGDFSPISTVRVKSLAGGRGKQVKIWSENSRNLLQFRVSRRFTNIRENPGYSGRLGRCSTWR